VQQKESIASATKLKVNEPDDIYEQEADRIADVGGANQPSALRPILELIFGADLAPFTRGPAQVGEILSIPSPRIENALLQDIDRAYRLQPGKTGVVEGLAGESLVHWIFRIDPGEIEIRPLEGPGNA
jgi:hypothetical protein